MVLFEAHASGASNIKYKIEADRLPLFDRSTGGYYTAQYGAIPSGPEYVWQCYNSCVLINGSKGGSSRYMGFILIFDEPTEVTFMGGTSVHARYQYNKLENGVYGRADIGNTHQYVIQTVDNIPYLSDEDNNNTREFIIDSSLIPYTDSWETYKADITNLAPSLYQWSSVSSVVGKGKTYKFTDILNINDGNAVNDVQASGNVNFSKKTKVNNMIDDVQIIDDSRVTVEYSIPNGDYTWIKLVYKRNSIPEDESDGTYISITKDSTKQYITDIIVNGKYWFKIFTNNSESEEVSLQIGNENQLMLIDSYNMYHHPIVDLNNTGFIDGMISKESCYWWYEEDGTFIGYDRTQAQAKCVFKTPLRKGTATVLYVECISEAVYNYPGTGWGLFDLMPTSWGYPDTDAKGHVLKWLYDFANQTKAVYEITLDDIDKNKVFYIAFYRNSTRNIFYKMWFDGMPEFFIINDFTTWNNYLGDNVIKVKYSNGENKVTVNTIYDWEHIVYEADVEESSNYSFKYDCKCNLKAEDRTYTANQMAAYILTKNPEGNADWWTWQGYILSENGGNLKTLGTSYQTYNTTFTTREGMKKVWICINYSALADGQNVTFTYKNISLTKTS